MNTNQTHLHDLEDILGAVYGLADMLEQSGSHEGSEDEAPALSRFHRGCMTTAIKHLANRANSLVDIIGEQEAGKAGGSNAK
ncbi:hypothetical protein [Vreelandella hamiltonii]|uniref:Uncharacterized protein n=1 Tax=Vreelandella hamiltonii TaxID=502829 RepID=A0A8H9I1S0_9GAMM|nr:hypothetical protein [Halomonas hamiltonii]GGW22979.1 hypothetical protein GCM10007157_12680 [Halomonas hamiltonii]